MKFIPYDDKIEIEPFSISKIIKSEETSLIEAGKVVAVGSKVTFVKVGDTLYFDSWGCSKTPEREGKRHYLVAETSAVILGKEDAPE